MIDLKNLTIKKAHAHLTNRDFSAVELANAYKQAIHDKNSDINAYLEVFKDIDQQAKLADAKLETGHAHVLTGIPIAIKDNILIKGRIASSASKMLEHYHATYDATVISNLKAHEAVFLGRAN